LYPWLVNFAEDSHGEWTVIRFALGSLRCYFDFAQRVLIAFKLLRM
jgi:hypothetical protein